MKLAVLNENQVGNVLAKPMYGPNGMVLVRAGQALTENVVKRLQAIGIGFIYIEDANAEVIVEEMLPALLKIDILKGLKEVYTQIKKNKTIDQPKLEKLANMLIDNVDISENAVWIDDYGTEDEIGKLATHSVEVAICNIKMSTLRKLGHAATLKLVLAAYLHGIGKLLVDKDYYIKANDLIKSTTAFGATIYTPILHIHENIDGSGPHGITGEKVHPYAQMLHISNNYVNLLRHSDQPYQAIEALVSDAARKFDEDILKSALSTFYCYANGMSVELTDGQKGIVLRQTKGLPSRPVIKLDKTKEEIDLTKVNNIFISKVYWSK